MYQRGTWTCPSSNPGTSEKVWDFAVLSPAKFMKKYQITKEEYEALKEGKA
jgi:hypothetical protein